MVIESGILARFSPPFLERSHHEPKHIFPESSVSAEGSFNKPVEPLGEGFASAELAEIMNKINKVIKKLIIWSHN